MREQLRIVAFGQCSREVAPMTSTMTVVAALNIDGISSIAEPVCRESHQRVGVGRQQD